MAITEQQLHDNLLMNEKKTPSLFTYVPVTYSLVNPIHSRSEVPVGVYPNNNNGVLWTHQGSLYTFDNRLLCFWFWVGPSAVNEPLLWANGASSNINMVIDASDHLLFQSQFFDRFDFLAIPTTVTRNAWHHVTVVHYKALNTSDQTWGMKLYLDNVLVGDMTANNRPLTDTIGIGKYTMEYTVGYGGTNINLGGYAYDFSMFDFGFTSPLRSDLAGTVDALYQNNWLV